MKDYNTLESLKNLPENWNGYGASIVNRRSLENADKLLGISKIPLSIFATNDGFVQLEGKMELEFEIEVLPDKYEFTIWKGEKMIYEKTFTLEQYNDIV